MKYSIYILIMLSAFIIQCSHPISIDELKKIEVQNRIDKMIALEKKKCKEKAMKKAIAKADSILIAEAKFFIDTLDKAPKPEKPELIYQPKHKFDIELKPIFKDTSKI